MKNITSLNSSLNASLNTSAIDSAISESTTLNELIEKLGSIEELPKKPTPKYLRENVAVVASADGCTVYANGYAYYDNGSSYTVFFIGDCGSFTYHFNPLNDNEKTYQKENCTVDDLGSQSWIVALMIRGDHQIEANLNNSIENRKGIKVDEEEADGGDDKQYRGAYHYPSPEEECIRQETVKEQLDKLSDRQKTIYILNHYYGYTQSEIAEKLHIKQQSVAVYLKRAEAKITKNIF